MVILVSLSLSMLADVAPMSRDEWERHRQFARVIPVGMPSTSPAGYVIALLMGVFLSVWVVALEKQCSHRGESWRNFVSKASIECVMLPVLILVSCLCVEVLFCPCSTFLTMVTGKAVEHHEQSRLHDETYEEYLFYEKHCRTCGTALRYHEGRYCPKCNPRHSEDNYFMSGREAISTE